MEWRKFFTNSEWNFFRKILSFEGKLISEASGRVSWHSTCWNKCVKYSERGEMSLGTVTILTF